MEQPELSLIDEDFIDKSRRSDRPNRQVEMLKRLLSKEIKLVGRRNLVAGRAFSEMLTCSVLPYQNHALDAAAVVAELVALTKELKHEHERGAELGLREDELAFYDASCQNDTAVLKMGGELLKTRPANWSTRYAGNASIDWSEKEQVRAQMCATIRRLLTPLRLFAGQAARRDQPRHAAGQAPRSRRYQRSPTGRAGQWCDA